MFLDNKYTKIYFKIINSAKSRANSRKEAKQIISSVEGHHIIPSCIIKNKDIVYLTIREHYICHLLLVKMTTGDIQSKMRYAVTQFSRSNKLNSRQIEYARSFLQHPCTNARKENIKKSRLQTQKLKCKYCNKEYDPGNFKQYHDDNCKYNPNINLEVLNAISTRNSNSVKKSIKNGTFKHPSIISNNSIVCPHCNFIGKNKMSMNRFHFNNCKNLTGILHNGIKQKMLKCKKNPTIFFCE